VNKPLRVLQVEDSESDAALIVRLLEKAGYDVFSRRVETSAEFRAVLADKPWDVIIADYRLPQYDALHALEELQSAGLDTPFIVVSGTVGEDVAVEMMKFGAQDYLMKDTLTRLAPAVEREIREAQMRRRRRQAEETVRHSEERYRMILETSIDGFWVADSEGRLLDVNRAYCRLTGYSREELLRMRVQDLDVYLGPAESRSRSRRPPRRARHTSRPSTAQEMATSWTSRSARPTCPSTAPAARSCAISALESGRRRP